LLRFLGKREKEKTAKAVEKTRQAWFGRVTSLFHGARLDQEFWDELEELLVSADVGVAPTQGLLERLRKRVDQERVSESEDALELLKQEMVALLDVDGAARRLESEETPLVLLVVGVNGAGKTTSIAKLARLYQDEGKQVLLGVDVIAHRPDADPGAVAFDTLAAARARGVDVAIIDTAGRLHSKAHLMEEIKKIQRVLSRQEGKGSQRVLLVLDATTGQNGLRQARAFTEALDCDGVFLAKLDGTARGGMVVEIAAELKLPVLFVGAGEQPEDIAPFDPVVFVDALFSSGDSD